MSRMKYEKQTLYVAIIVASITRDKEHERFNINLAWFNKKHVKILKHNTMQCLEQLKTRGGFMSFNFYLLWWISILI